MTKKWDVMFDRGDDECFFFTIRADRVRIVEGEICIDLYRSGTIILDAVTIEPSTFCIRGVSPHGKRPATCFVCGRNVYAEPRLIVDDQIEDCGCSELDDAELIDEWEYLEPSYQNEDTREMDELELASLDLEES